MATIQKLNNQMERLVRKHRRLDIEIKNQFQSGHYDDLELGEMKKRKLQMREEIVSIDKQICDVLRKQNA
jgi:hypothetical protein